jgi:uncharacterized OB-fold protein
MTIPGIPSLEGTYPSTMDPYPFEAKEFNRIYQFYENLKEKRLTATKCKSCGYVSFPPRVVCPECNSDELDWTDLPTRGKVRLVTEEFAGVPLGWETPLIHALVDLGEGHKFISRITSCQVGQLKEGDEVQLTVYDIPPMIIEKREGMVESPRVFFAFEPVKRL